MSAARSYDSLDVADERDTPPPLDPTGDVPPDPTARREPGSRARAARTLAAPDEPPQAPDGVDLSALSIGGITRRRAGWVAAVLVAAWIVVIFAKQTGEATQAAQRADQIAAENAALVAEVEALESELRLIERPAYVAHQARGYQLGTSNEIPFSLAPTVKAPAPNSPGSASGRLGAAAERVTPLESWLSLLFGPLD
jgi:cell division protein FtsB